MEGVLQYSRSPGWSCESFDQKCFDQLKSTITNLSSQIVTLNEIINQLKNDRQTIKDSVSKIDQIKQELTTEITEVKTNLGGIKEKIVDLSTKISGLLTFVPNLVHKTREYFMNIVSNIKTGTIENIYVSP
jgi:chromosome segregation ATPase